MASTGMNFSASATLELFLEELRPRALRVAWMEVRETALADDLVQDAMLRLVQSYRHRPPAEWTPLFYRILRNRITDWRRHCRVESIISYFTPSNDGDEEASAPDYADTRPTPEAQLQGQELGARIDWALRQLPTRQREVFLLREWEGMSVAEAAVAMGVSEGSVKTHHFRALSRLRALLGDDGAGDEGAP